MPTEYDNPLENRGELYEIIGRVEKKEANALSQIWGSAEFIPDVDRVIGNCGEESVFYFLAASQGYSTPEGLWDYHLRQSDTNNLIKLLNNVNNLTLKIWAHAHVNNVDLHRALTTPVTREDGPGEYDEGRVPESYFEKITPSATPSVWGASRLLVLLADKNNIIDFDNPEIWRIVDETIKDSGSPEEFLCGLAEKVFEKTDSVGDVMDRVLKYNKLAEENDFGLYRKIIEEMRARSPKLWDAAIKAETEINSSGAKAPKWVKILGLYREGETS